MFPYLERGKRVSAHALGVAGSAVLEDHGANGRLERGLVHQLVPAIVFSSANLSSGRRGRERKREKKKV